VAEIITSADLPAAVQADELVGAMVDGANAKASRVAPCLTWDGTVESQPAPSADTLAEARLVLIGAIKRWHEAGSGALSTQAAGPFSMGLDTRQKSSGFNLRPSEIDDLQALCRPADVASGAFTIDSTPAAATEDGYWSAPDAWTPIP
jgi:hypothetical protein